MSKKILVICTSIIAASLMLYFKFIDENNGDLGNYVIPWFGQLVARGLPAVSGEFSQYNPPYLYLLWVVTPLHSVLSDIRLIKIVSIFFNVVSACVIAFIVRKATMDQNRAALAGAAFLALPTIAFNSAYWGQCDITYASFVLLFILYSMKRDAVKAVVFFSLALSFKLQTMLIAPYLLYLLLRRSVSLYHLILIPLVYSIAVLPAWLMGRPALDLIHVYVAQLQYGWGRLSMNAPNLYNIVEDFNLVGYSTGVLTMGIMLASVVGIVIAVCGLKLRDEDQGKLVVASASAIMMPFVLPKMHDRYFFLADVLTYLLAFVVPNTWPLALAMQIASLSAYGVVFFNWKLGADFGALVTTIAVAGIIFVYSQQSKRAFDPTFNAGAPADR